MNDLNTTYQVAAIAAVLGGGFSFAILRPLNNAITELRTLIRELRDDLKRNEEKWHTLEVKIAEVDQRTRALYRRLDDMHIPFAREP